MSAKQFLAYTKKRQTHRRNKYGAKKQTYNGRSYDSQMEARFAQALDLRLKAGEIKAWKPQHRVELKGENGSTIGHYKVDFLVEYHDGTLELVEVKGFKTRDWALKWKLLKDKFGNDKKYKLTLVERF